MKRDTIIEAGMNAIPYVGGSLTTLYFGNKKEKRFQRIEQLYQEMAEELKNNPIDKLSFSENNKEEFVNLIEDLHNKVEIETREKKKKLLKNFFIQTLKKPIRNDFDERKSFLQALDNLSELECDLLAFFVTNSAPVQIRTLSGGDIYALYAGVNKLISFGFLETRRGSFIMNGTQDENLDDLVALSDYGKKFVEYVKIN